MKFNLQSTLLNGIGILAAIALIGLALLQPPADAIVEKTDWIKVDLECNIPYPHHFSDYPKTFEVSYKLLRALSGEYPVRITRAVGRHTICVTRMEVGEIKIDALNASYDRLARPLCKAAKEFTKQYGDYRVYIQFAVDTSEVRDGARHISEYVIKLASRECS